MIQKQNNQNSEQDCYACIDSNYREFKHYLGLRSRHDYREGRFRYDERITILSEKTIQLLYKVISTLDYSTYLIERAYFELREVMRYFISRISSLSLGFYDTILTFCRNINRDLSYLIRTDGLDFLFARERERTFFCLVRNLKKLQNYANNLTGKNHGEVNSYLSKKPKDGIQFLGLFLSLAEENL